MESMTTTEWLLIGFAAYATICTAGYGAMCFIEWKANPLEWHIVTRTFFALWCLYFFFRLVTVIADKFS